MNKKHDTPRMNWGSLIGGALFLLFALGRPLSQMLGQIWRSGAIPPIPWGVFAPAAFGGIALLIGALVIRQVFQGSMGENNRPPAMPSLPPSQPPEIRQLRYDPVINPRVVLAGVVGVIVLAVFGVLLLS